MQSVPFYLDCCLQGKLATSCTNIEILNQIRYLLSRNALKPLNAALHNIIVLDLAPMLANIAHYSYILSKFLIFETMKIVSELRDYDSWLASYICIILKSKVMCSQFVAVNTFCFK